MAFAITNRAFQFAVQGRQLALDIQNDGVIYDKGPAVHLFERVSEGWHRVHEPMEPVLYVTQQGVDQMGGIIEFCKAVIEKVNRALRILFGIPDGEDLPDPVGIHEQVMDYLRTHLEVRNGQLHLS